VWLPQHAAWAIPRYKNVKECLRNTDVFVLGQGVALNDKFNGIMRGNAVTADGDLHTKLRKVMGEPMLPGCSRRPTTTSASFVAEVHDRMRRYWPRRISSLG
jgi:cytochrome P450